MIYFIFLILRLLDIFTTYKCLSSNCSTELNPFNAFLIDNFGLNKFVFINFSLSILVLLAFYLTSKYKISKITLYSFLTLNLIVVISNFLLP